MTHAYDPGTMEKRGEYLRDLSERVRKEVQNNQAGMLDLLDVDMLTDIAATLEELPNDTIK